jgi:uncharacterized repeat protein (TIGR01451 family)
MQPGDAYQRRQRTGGSGCDPDCAHGLITNTVEVTTLTYEENLANNTDSETTTVMPQSDMSLVKIDEPDPVLAGEVLTYTLTVVNHGPSLATGVVVTDNIPEDFALISVDPPAPVCSLSAGDLTCELGDIPQGNSVTIIIVGQVQPTFIGTLFNAAQVSSTTYDPDPGDNQASTTTQVQASSDLVLEMSAVPEWVRNWVPITYTLWITNAGPSEAVGVVVSDTLPIEVVYVASQPPVCALAGNILTCPMGSLPSGGSSQLEIYVGMETGVGANLLNQAEVTSNTPDPNYLNNYVEVVQPIDNVLPAVNWISPVGNGGTYFAHGEVITLAVDANDFNGSGVDYVWFYYYDQSNNRITIAEDYSPPYLVLFDTSILPVEYNTQTYARAYDIAGNEGNRVRINIYYTLLEYRTFLPMLLK